MKKVYVLLTGTGTILARTVRLVKGGTYSHTSLSLTPTTDCFYSFSRLKANNPFVAAFNVENIHTEVFARYPNCKCALYSLEISDKAYEKISEQITKFSENRKKAKYNMFGLLALLFGIKLKRKWRLTCSQFVALLLECTGEIELPKDPYLMLPTDFMNIKSVNLVYRGVLKDCAFPVSNTIAN